MVSMIIYWCDVVLLLVGGVQGFRAGSRISLVMGSISACVMVVSLLAMKRFPLSSHVAIALLSLALVAVFVIRLVKTGAFMPAGLMLIVSAVVLATAIQGYFRLKA